MILGPYLADQNILRLDFGIVLDFFAVALINVKAIYLLGMTKE